MSWQRFKKPTDTIQAPSREYRPSLCRQAITKRTTDQRHRTDFVFSFKLRAYYTIAKETEAETAETALEEVVDEILTEFKERNVLGSVCDWVEPAPSVWEYETRGEAVYRVAEVTLRCVKYVA